MLEKSKLAENIKRLRLLKQDITLDELGAMLIPKRSGKTIWSWESARTQPHLHYLPQLCQIFGVSMDYLFGTEGGSRLYGADTFEMAPIPLLGSLSTGNVLEILPNKETYPIPKLIIDRHPKAFLLRQGDDSMSAIFQCGTLVLVDPEQTEPQDGQIFALSIDRRETAIRRIRMFSDRIALLADSADERHTETAFPRDSERIKRLSILGKIIWHVPSYTGKY